MEIKRRDGIETWMRLREWMKGQSAAERLASHILYFSGFTAIDPSHPLGGKDGLKDVICSFEEEKWVGAAYFPRGQKKFQEIKKKFIADLVGVSKNNVVGIAFVTNQEISLSERGELTDMGTKAGAKVDIFHVERIASILDSPSFYGLRLEFLDIEMTKDEQLSYFAERDEVLKDLLLQFGELSKHIKEANEKPGFRVPNQEIKEFQKILDDVAGSRFDHVIRMFPYRRGHVDQLHVPIEDMREFEEILNRIVRNSISSIAFGRWNNEPAVQDLKVPLKDLIQYEERLDRIIEKKKQAGI